MLKRILLAVLVVSAFAVAVSGPAVACSTDGDDGDGGSGGGGGGGMILSVGTDSGDAPSDFSTLGECV